MRTAQAELVASRQLVARLEGQLRNVEKGLLDARRGEMYAAVFSVIAFSAIAVGFLERCEIKFFRPEKKVRR